MGREKKGSENPAIFANCAHEDNLGPGLSEDAWLRSELSGLGIYSHFCPVLAFPACVDR